MNLLRFALLLSSPYRDLSPLFPTSKLHLECDFLEASALRIVAEVPLLLASYRWACGNKVALGRLTWQMASSRRPESLEHSLGPQVFAQKSTRAIAGAQGCRESTVLSCQYLSTIRALWSPCAANLLMLLMLLMLCLPRRHGQSVRLFRGKQKDSEEAKRASLERIQTYSDLCSTLFV